MNNPNAVIPLVDSTIYTGGSVGQNTSFHRGNDENNLVVQLAQLVGRNTARQPEPIDSVGNGIITAPGLYGQMGTNFVYYVRTADTNSAEFVSESQGKIKKIVTFPVNATAQSIIRVTVFFYQNPTYTTRVTTIKDYEEAAGYYMVTGTLTYDVNSAVQNNINPNV